MRNETNLAFPNKSVRAHWSFKQEKAPPRTLPATYGYVRTTKFSQWLSPSGDMCYTFSCDTPHTTNMHQVCLDMFWASAGAVSSIKKSLE